MWLFKELFVGFCVISIGHIAEGAYANGKCGQAFVKALYQACAVAKRAFEKSEIPQLQQEKYPVERGNGGSFGSWGAGGMFRKMLGLLDAQEIAAREMQRDDSEGTAGQQYSADLTQGLENNVMAYLKNLEQASTLDKRNAGFHEGAMEYINHLASRGNTATNLLADYCCKHGCNWKTFVGLCK